LRNYLYTNDNHSAMMRKAYLRGVSAASPVVVLLLSLVIIMLLVPTPATSQGTDSLGFGDNVSAQVKRANQTAANSSNGNNTATANASPLLPSQQQPSKPSGCLIATAAFGSELTPQVQFLRDFRDNHILSTAAGSSFMNVFNSWYYSFSPSVADFERANPWSREIIKASIYPLLGILQVAERGYSMPGGEGGAVLAGFTASGLIGAVYLSPAAVLLRNKTPGKKLLTILGVSALVSLAVTVAGVVMRNSDILMVSTALFVLSSIGVGLSVMMVMAKKIEETYRC
jgi:hypothetical protein